MSADICRYSAVARWIPGRAPKCTRPGPAAHGTLGGTLTGPRSTIKALDRAPTCTHADMPPRKEVREQSSEPKGKGRGKSSSASRGKRKRDRDVDPPPVQRRLSPRKHQSPAREPEDSEGVPESEAQVPREVPATGWADEEEEAEAGSRVGEEEDLTTSQSGFISSEAETRIAQFYEENPMFYDLGHKDYKNRVKRDAALKELADELGLTRE